MKLIKHLLSHTGLIVVVCFALAVVYFRAEIFPAYINEPVDTALNEIGEMIGVEIPSYVQTENDNDDKAEQETIVAYSENVLVDEDVSEPQTVEEDTDDSVVTTITESVTDTVSALFSSDEENVSEVEVQENAETTQQELMVSQTNDSSDSESTVNNVTQKITNTIGEIADAIIPSKDDELSESRKILIKARKAYWEGSLENAEMAYKELVEHEDLDPNAYGELGNVYYAQGKWQEAGKAYYEAAVRLIELKQPHQVNYLLRVIQGLDAESAEKLKQKMSG
ncbi:MAG: hypothetical protein OQK73_07970, partial [Gammaproteobacteria bacterium]|nr:hypothetical protein [Gammaproteobacteria bacterium]